jgi:hypothetical protein
MRALIIIQVALVVALMFVTTDVFIDSTGFGFVNEVYGGYYWETRP